MKPILMICVSLLVLLQPLHAQPVKIIFDTDIDSDVDDVGALAMLHTLADHGMAEILGVIVTSDDPHAPSCTDAINVYFKRPAIPIGVQKGIELREHSRYTKQIKTEYPHHLKTYGDAEDATVLYRRILASQPDESVVIVTVGHLSNLRNLIESGPCRYSKLTGIELIKRKVKLWSCMGGHFPEGKEANFYRPDPLSTKISVEKWPVRVVFAGWEIGNKIITGAEFLKRRLDNESPVWRSYLLYNNFRGRQSWDQAAVVFAVTASSDYWDLETSGRCQIFEDGSNKWLPGKESNHAYLKEKMDPVEIAKIIDALMTGTFIPGL